MTTTSARHPIASVKSLLAALLLSLSLLGVRGAGASATPAVVPMRDTGGVGGGAGLVAGVQEAPLALPERRTPE